MFLSFIAQRVFFAASACQPKGSFFGFPTWYKYLPGEQVTNNAAGGGSECIVRIANLSDTWLVGAAVIEILLRVAMIVSISFVIVGGVKFITSQAEPDKTKAARETVINALIGLVISVAATGVITFIAGRFK